MSVYLLRAYGGFAASATVPVTFQDDVETALIAQGLATAGPTTDMSLLPAGTQQYVNQGGSLAMPPQGEQGYATPTYRQGIGLIVNAFLPAALTTFETNGAAQVAGTWNYAEIFVPHWHTWTGAGWLNGTTVGTNNGMVALWGSNGTLIANSAVAGAVTAGASTFQNAAFLFPQTLAPGRYFVGVQLNGTTDTVRHILAPACWNATNGIVTGSQTGTFGTAASITTVSSTFTSAQGPIMQLYT